MTPRAKRKPRAAKPLGWWGPLAPPAVASTFPEVQEIALECRSASADRAFAAVVAGPRRSP